MEECVWKEIKDRLGYQDWRLSCGYVVEEEVNPVYHGFVFCPKCGKRIRFSL